ncbi:hypothetical protein CEXT_412581 [Caerostris extrusa]|uniref:Uncharacterized protein n=1 Tax=Caerostris extrusa TaxID=172846 RepID=A0AAV4SV69_CAEEX|nr:hypothetical protein CEXT_412581 [Caerostris extrusa]
MFGPSLWQRKLLRIDKRRVVSSANQNAQREGPSHSSRHLSEKSHPILIYLRVHSQNSFSPVPDTTSEEDAISQRATQPTDLVVPARFGTKYTPQALIWDRMAVGRVSVWLGPEDVKL